MRQGKESFLCLRPKAGQRGVFVRACVRANSLVSQCQSFVQIPSRGFPTFPSKDLMKFAEQVCVTKSRFFKNRDDLPTPPLGITLGIDDKWESLREVLNPYFFSKNNLSIHVQDVADKAMALVDVWMRRGGEVELSSECTALSQSVLLKILYSTDVPLWERSPPTRSSSVVLALLALGAAWFSLLTSQVMSDSINRCMKNGSCSDSGLLLPLNPKLLWFRRLLRSAQQVVRVSLGLPLSRPSQTGVRPLSRHHINLL
jgi:hypothetical protein